MLRRNAEKSLSFPDGFRIRGFLPLLAMMLLVAPQLAYSQGSLLVTVDPRSLDLNESGADNEDTYTIRFTADPKEDVDVTVVGAPTECTPGIGGIMVDSSELTFLGGDSDNPNWSTDQTVTVTACPAPDGADEVVTLTHTARVGSDEDEVALQYSSVRVRVIDGDAIGVTVSTNPATTPVAVTVEEASTSPGTYTVNLATQPTGTVTVDVGGVSGEISVRPTRLVFTQGNWVSGTGQTVSVYAGEDFDADNDTATLTHTVSGGDYTNESADSVVVTVTDNDRGRSRHHGESDTAESRRRHE